jgi:hypothetical protein
MLTVPMFARYISEVTADQPLQPVPWSRPPGVKPDDTGGTLRTTMEEVKADDAARPALVKPGAPKPPGLTPGAKAPVSTPGKH